MASDVKECYDWGVLGCGWLGKAFARQLAEAGQSVWGSTRSQERFPAIADAGAHPVEFDLDHAGHPPTWPPPCHHLLVAVNPSVDTEALGNVLRSAMGERTRWCVVISSTSVYPDEPRNFEETDAMDRTSPHSGVSVLKFEQALASSRTSFLRAGGLIGPGRPLFRPTQRPIHENRPLVVTHVDDIIAAVLHVARHEMSGPTNLVCPIRRTRAECTSRSDGTEAASPSRSISSQRILDSGFTFRHPDPCSMSNLHH